MPSGTAIKAFNTTLFITTIGTTSTTRWSIMQRPTWLMTSTTNTRYAA